MSETNPVETTCSTPRRDLFLWWLFVVLRWIATERFAFIHTMRLAAFCGAGGKKNAESRGESPTASSGSQGGGR